MPEEHVYRVNDKDHGAVILGTTFSAFFILFMLYGELKFGALLFSPLFIFCFFTAIRFSYDKIIITDTEITVTRYFRVKKINWSDVSSLEAQVTGFLLRNPGGDTQVFVSGEVINFWEFIKLVNERRVNLLCSTKTVFHENPIVAWFMGIVGSFIAYYSVAQIISNPTLLIQKIMFLGIGLAFILIGIFALKKFSFDEDKLIVRTLVREHVIHSKDIDSGSISNKAVLIIAKNRYSVSIDHLLEGIPSFLIAFQSWLKSYPMDFPETSGDLYEA